MTQHTPDVVSLDDQPHPLPSHHLPQAQGVATHTKNSNGSGQWRFPRVELRGDAPDKDYMAIDQWGTTYHGLGPYPRKALLERFARKRAEKIYIDDEKSSESFHVGYIIARMWLTLYEVKPMRRRWQ